MLTDLELGPEPKELPILAGAAPLPLSGTQVRSGLGHWAGWWVIFPHVMRTPTAFQDCPRTCWMAHGYAGNH